MSEADVWKIVLTALFTLFGGVILFLVGQFLQKFVFETAQEQVKAISEVCFRLIHYAPFYANPGLRATEEQNKQAQDASNAIRESASRLQATTDAIYWYILLSCIEVVPTSTKVEKAIGHLIRISNSIDTDNGRENSKDADKVYSLLTGRSRRFIPS